MFTAWLDGCPDDSSRWSPQFTERTGGASQSTHVPQGKGEQCILLCVVLRLLFASFMCTCNLCGMHLLCALAESVVPIFSCEYIPKRYISPSSAIDTFMHHLYICMQLQVRLNDLYMPQIKVFTLMVLLAAMRGLCLQSFSWCRINCRTLLCEVPHVFSLLRE